jgi:hypothetical protein
MTGDRLTNYCNEFLKITFGLGILERVKNSERSLITMEGDSHSLGGVNYSWVLDGLLIAKVTLFSLTSPAHYKECLMIQSDPFQSVPKHGILYFISCRA